MRALRGKDLHNGAMVALDYRTGDVLAYVGSAGYTRDALRSRQFEPKFDAAGDGARQPGSAWKPVLYAAAFDAKRLTPGSVLLDVTTEFNRAEDWHPTDADQRERGPVRVRKAIQYSLNIPAIRALQRVGNERVAKTAEAMGIRFMGGRESFLQAGLAGALGTVEVRPLDLTAAYGTIANGGLYVPPRMVLEVRTADGRLVWQAGKPAGKRAISTGAAYQVTDILAGNTDPKQNDIWAPKLELRGPGGTRRRPAAVKTGTTNDARDLGTYGFLPPTKSGLGLVVGVWLGNSDHSYPRAAKPAISLTAAAPLWRAFMRDYTGSWAVSTFKPPKDVVRAQIDAWSGGRPGPWTRDTRFGMVHPRHAAGGAPGDRPERTPVPDRLWRLERRPAPGGARPGLVGGRRPELDGSSAPRRGRRWAVRIGDGLLLGPALVGWPDPRIVREPPARPGRRQPREWQGQGEQGETAQTRRHAAAADPAAGPRRTPLTAAERARARWR